MLEPVQLQPPPAPRHPISVGLKSRAGVAIGVGSLVVAVLLAIAPARRTERVGRLGTAAALAAIGALIAGVTRADVRRHQRAVSALHRWAASRGWVVDAERVQGTFAGLPMAVRVGYDRRGQPVAFVCEVGGHRPGWWAMVEERFEEGDDAVTARIDALCAATRGAA